MSTTPQMSPGERQELRRVVRQRFKILRAEVTRREAEMRAEVETELAHRYAAQDTAITAHNEAIEEARHVYERAVHAARRELQAQHPELTVGMRGGVEDRNRSQVRAAALTAIPTRVADAQLDLDRQETTLLEALATDALAGDAARGFLAGIPTVGALVPLARLEALVRGGGPA